MPSFTKTDHRLLYIESGLNVNIICRIDSVPNGGAEYSQPLSPPPSSNADSAHTTAAPTTAFSPPPMSQQPPGTTHPPAPTTSVPYQPQSTVTTGYQGADPTGSTAAVSSVGNQPPPYTVSQPPYSAAGAPMPSQAPSGSSNGTVLIK